MPNSPTRLVFTLRPGEAAALYEPLTERDPLREMLRSRLALDPPTIELTDAEFGRVIRRMAESDDGARLFRRAFACSVADFIAPIIALSWKEMT